MDSKTKLYVISHTHWDREWYETFQQYRYRLVKVMDDLILQLEQHPEFSIFHLDGQTIPLEDYLEIRPENRGRLESLIWEGRIVIGPWYVMPDEFLVSGESLIKNLQIGHEICASYGVRPMKSGYVTDIFGHNSQFPQLLNGFGIDSAVLYRGIGDYEKDLFLWKSPDGSSVIAAKLDRERSYSNFYFAVRWPYEGKEYDPEDALRRMEELLDFSRSLAASDHILMMDGVDHIGMEPHVPRMIQAFEKEIPNVIFRHACLNDYFAAVRSDHVPLDTITGPLYHVAERGVNNQVLKNVLSSMVHLKQENDNCERLLTNFAEPLNAFAGLLPGGSAFLPDSDFSPRRHFLDTAWKYLIQNQPHDSICGCSISEVHRDNEYRFRQAYQIGELSQNECLEWIGKNLEIPQDMDGALLLYNPAQIATPGIIRCMLNVKQEAGKELYFYGPDGEPLPVQILEEKNELLHQSDVRRLISFMPIRFLDAVLPLSIPAFGYTAIFYRLLPAAGINTEQKSYTVENWRPANRLTGRMQTGHNTFDNGILLLTVNDSGTLTITDKRTGKTYHDQLLFEDGADRGDGWNYRKPPYDRVRYAKGCRFFWEVCDDRDYALRLRLTHHFELPEGLSDGVRSQKETCLTLHTTITLLKDSPRITFRTELDNNVSDHRLRVLFPTGLCTDAFYTKTPFDMQRWEIAAEPYAERTETETFVHPSQGITWISDGTDSVTLSAQGLYETEVTDNAEHAIALTLMRAFAAETGTTRTADVQLQRHLTFDYTLAFGDASCSEALCQGEADRMGLVSSLIPDLSVCRGGTLPASYSFLGLEAEAKQISGIFAGTEPHSLRIRLFDVSGHPEFVRLTLPATIQKAFLQRLDGSDIAELTCEGNQVGFSCAPHQIVTVSVQM